MKYKKYSYTFPPFRSSVYWTTNPSLSLSDSSHVPEYKLEDEK